MALFSFPRRYVTPAPPPRRMIVVRQAARVPSHMARLDVLCHCKSHPLPCRAKFIGFSRSDKGQPIAMYACPLCNCRQGWCRDHATGRPRPLFARNGGHC